jgi:imidazoleglycerol-phosphate dehydratase
MFLSDKRTFDMRKANVIRNTKETEISCTVNLDGLGVSNISTGIGFMDHMLEILSHHSLIDIDLKVRGDIYVDLHHSVEDAGYALSQSILLALGEKLGIRRYGFFYVPMDECLSRCVLDFSGRPELVWNVELGLKKIGEMDTELFQEFFKAFSNEAKCTLHIENLYGKNNHHIIESCFKAFAKSLRISIEIDEKIKNIIPSSKGIL